jgi:hypothetical protein
MDPSGKHTLEDSPSIKVPKRDHHVAEFLSTDFQLATLFPPAPMIAPRWTPYLEKMSNANIYTQVAMSVLTYHMSLAVFSPQT